MNHALESEVDQQVGTPILISTLDETDFIKVKVMRDIRDLERKIKAYYDDPDEITEMIVPSWRALLKGKVKLAKSLKELKLNR